MMRNMKKIFALAIAVIMAVSTMPFIAMADVADFSHSNKDLEGAINLLAALGIIAGVDPNADGIVFDGGSPVTREQFAVFVARIHSARPEWFGGLQTHDTEFSDDADISGWAKYAVFYCVQEGIVNGVGDNNFAPQREVTMQEAVTMLVRSLGYTGLDYPDGFLDLAEAENPDAQTGKLLLLGENAVFNLYDEFAPADILTRYGMAQLLYNYLTGSEIRMISAPTAEGRISFLFKPIFELFAERGDKYLDALVDFGLVDNDNAD